MIPFMQSKLVGTDVILNSEQLVAPSDWISGFFKLKINGETTNAIYHNYGWAHVFNEIRILSAFTGTALSVT